METSEKFRQYIAQEDASFRIFKEEQLVHDQLFVELHESANELISKYHAGTTCMSQEGLFQLEELVRKHCDHLAFNVQEIVKKYSELG